MSTKAILAPALIGLLTLLIAAPQGAFGQGSGGAPTFRQEELDQMLAPIALYPDSLLANVLVAATYPIEVVQADRWVKENKNLKGEQLNAALDKMEWDLSVKALVPFPQVLGMMSDRLDWTQKLGDAFLAQQADVMDTVQKLRGKAQAQGNLKTTREQNVIVEKETIVIEPANPTVVYVPAYNPEVVYGSWWYPSYPPYAYYPAGYAFAGAAFGFAAGVAVGAAWNHGWGHWDWGHHDMNVNINRNANINRNSVSHYQSGSWRHDSAHRGGVAYRNNAARERYGQKGVGSADARRDYRGFSGDAGAGGGRGAGQRPSADQTMKSLQQRGGAGVSDRAGLGSGGRAGAGAGVSDRAGMGPGGRGAGVSDRAGPGSGGRPGAGSTLGGSGRGAFGNMDSGGGARMSSDRGRSSRDFSSMGGGRGAGGFQGGRGFSGGSRGGGFSGGGRSGGGGGFGGGGRGGGGRGGRR